MQTGLLIYINFISIGFASGIPAYVWQEDLGSKFCLYYFVVIQCFKFNSSRKNTSSETNEEWVKNSDIILITFESPKALKVSLESSNLAFMKI